MKREPAAVLRDVRDGIISERAANEICGVVLTEGGEAVDAASTGARREGRPGVAPS
jgi:hypothetical protein